MNFRHPIPRSGKPGTCEFCGHYPSYRAAPGVPCERCSLYGIGDPCAGTKPPKPRINLAAQEELVCIVPRVEPDLTADMQMVERILAVFDFNVCEVH